jgi:hypothetical protein
VIRSELKQGKDKTVKTLRNALFAGLLCMSVAVRAESVETRIGKLDFELCAAGTIFREVLATS